LRLQYFPQQAFVQSFLLYSPYELCTRIADVIFNCNYPSYVFDLHPVHRAGSFALNEQSVSSLGSAYAGGAAQAEDAWTIFFNPTGLALLDHGELQIGDQFIIPSIGFRNQGSHLVALGTPFNNEPLTGGNGGDRLIPNVYLSQTLFRSSAYGYLSVDYAHLFLPDATVDFTDSLGHNLKGKFSDSLDIVNAAITLLLGSSQAVASA
jgi:hypothetical protein